MKALGRAQGSWACDFGEGGGEKGEVCGKERGESNLIEGYLKSWAKLCGSLYHRSLQG